MRVAVLYLCGLGVMRVAELYGECYANGIAVSAGVAMQYVLQSAEFYADVPESSSPTNALQVSDFVALSAMHADISATSSVSAVSCCDNDDEYGPYDDEDDP